MDRTLARLAAILLVGTALTACSTFDSGTASSEAHGDAKAASSTKGTDLDAQVRVAQSMRGQSDYQGATKVLSQLMMVAPDDFRVVGEYGKNLVQQGRSKEALDFLRRAVELQPGDWTFYSATGVAYDQNGDYSNAKIAYQHALAIKPGDAGVLNNYALSRMQAGDVAAARQLMAQAQATGAADPKIARNVALLSSVAPEQTAAAAPAQTKPGAAPQAQSAPKTLVAQQHTAAPARVPPTVMMQQIPTDPKAGPVKVATAPPHRLAKSAPAAKAVATTAAAPKKVAAAPAPKQTAVALKSAPAKIKAAKNQTPALRMTADAGTP